MRFAQVDDNGATINVVEASDMESVEVLGGRWVQADEADMGLMYDDDWSTFAAPWRQPLGAFDAYPIDELVYHNGGVWQSLVEANVWEPGVANWRNTPPDQSTPPWVQPTGSEDAYQIGDLVTHLDKTWISVVANNVWEPGVYGWDEVVP